MPELNIPLTSKSPPLVAPTFANTTKQSSNKSKKKYNNLQPRSSPRHDQSPQLIHPAAAAAAVASTQRISSSSRPFYQQRPGLATSTSLPKSSLDRSKSKPKNLLYQILILLSLLLPLPRLHLNVVAFFRLYLCRNLTKAIQILQIITLADQTHYPLFPVHAIMKQTRNHLLHLLKVTTSTEILQ